MKTAAHSKNKNKNKILCRAYRSPVFSCVSFILFWSAFWNIFVCEIWAEVVLTSANWITRSNFLVSELRWWGRTLYQLKQDDWPWVMKGWPWGQRVCNTESPEVRAGLLQWQKPHNTSSKHIGYRTSHNRISIAQGRVESKSSKIQSFRWYEN
jgi:hypothetical protein